MINNPCFLFGSSDPKAEYRRLALQYHPDKGGTTKDFQALNEAWWKYEEVPVAKQGLLFWYRTNSSTIYIYKDHLEQRLNMPTDLYKPLRYPTEEARLIMEPCVPSSNKATLIKIDPGMIPLRLVKDKFKDPKDCAWLISRLMNICCLLRFNNRMHGCINIDNIMINKDKHWAGLYTGWEFSGEFGNLPEMVASDVFSTLPTRLQENFKSCQDVDLLAVKRLAAVLMDKKEDPLDPIATWIYTGSNTDSLFEYGRWEMALDKAFGKRKFMPMCFDVEEIYKQAICGQ